MSVAIFPVESEMRALFLALLLFVSAGEASSPSDVSWLEGCWETADKSAVEVWVQDSDGSLLGFGVATANNEVVFYELLRITVAANGNHSYAAYPKGQSPAAFPATSSKKYYIKFSNPNHDYPQQIEYVRDGSRLSATISKMGGEQAQTFEKVSCSQE